MGGLNIGDENLPTAPPRRAVRDTHFLVAGPVVGQLMENFAEDWWFTTGEILIGPDWLRESRMDSPTLARAVSSGPDQDLGKLELIMLSAVNVARRSVRIATPYFLPDESLCSALALAAMRGVAVEVVIPLHSDHVFLDWAMRAHVRPLIETGCTIWRRSPPFDHSKLMSVDDEWAMIGSANWDVRSLRLNFELDLEIYDERFAREISAMIADGKHERLTLAKLDESGLPIKLRDAAARLMLPYL
jgi:cardiolipin synthase